MADAQSSKYLDYLDKEMTIMGILSTFCLAAVALIIDRIGGAEPSKCTLFSQLWNQESTYVLLGSIFTAGAGALFYMQRSALAWFYGQITLSMESPGITNVSTKQWYKDADSWATWIPYQYAFTALTLGVAFYLVALLEVSWLHKLSALLLWIPVAALVIVQTIRMVIFKHYKYEDDPISKAFSILRRRGDDHPQESS